MRTKLKTLTKNEIHHICLINNCVASYSGKDKTFYIKPNHLILSRQGYKKYAELVKETKELALAICAKIQIEQQFNVKLIN